MAARKYLTFVSGVKTLVQAIVASAGAADEGKIVALDASGRLDNSLMPNGIGADTLGRPASEALAAGNIVNIWDDSATPKVRKADASVSGKTGVGFVLQGAALNAQATIYFEGTISGLSGLSTGQPYFLSPTAAGGITLVPPTASGQVLQYIGSAASPTELTFEPAEPILIA